MAETGLLGPALAQWNDYVGTAAADESGAGQHSLSLYEATGLDPALWIILSVDINTAGRARTVVVYAFDRAAHGVASHAELLEFGDQHGELPVTAFELRGSHVDQVASGAFERLAVRLTARGFRDQQLAVQTSSVTATPTTPITAPAPAPATSTGPGG